MHTDVVLDTGFRASARAADCERKILFDPVVIDCEEGQNTRWGECAVTRTLQMALAEPAGG